MKAALSRNEMEILDRHVATLTNQLSDIASLLESRLGETNELATSARSAQKEFARFALRIRRHTVVTRGVSGLTADLKRPESSASIRR